MSTRGCVAIGTGKEWKGVYNHYDSYPQGLGIELYEHLQGKDLNQFAEELVSFADWREYLNGGICQYCGNKVGQPHSISGVISSKGRDEAKYTESGKWDGVYPDPEAKHHSHTKQNGEAYINSNEGKHEALFIEWVYVVNPFNKTITILTNARAKGVHWSKNWKGEKYSTPNYQWVFVDRIELEKPKLFSWEIIEEKGNSLGETFSRKFNKNRW
jgi:hypothetical protein